MQSFSGHTRRKMNSRDLAKFMDVRRYASLVCVISAARATLTDEVIDLHERTLGSLFSREKAAKECFPPRVDRFPPATVAGLCEYSSGTFSRGLRPFAVGKPLMGRARLADDSSHEATLLLKIYPQPDLDCRC